MNVTKEYSMEAVDLQIDLSVGNLTSWRLQH
jgi:hypothetical protein